jgi:hypothetical protein
MTTLTVTAKGQVTLRKRPAAALRRGARPEDRGRQAADGRIEVKAAQPTGSIDDFIGLLAGKTRKVATIEEIDRAAASGWAGEE